LALRALTSPILQWSRIAFDAPRDAPARPAQDDKTSSRNKRWWTASTWTIIAVLTLLFFVALGLSADYQPYRFPMLLTLAIAEMALLAAILLRDHRCRKVEILLRESEQGMAMAAGAGDIGLWHWDTRSDRFWMTDRCRAILSVARDADYGLAAFAEAVHPDDLSLFRETMNRARAAKAAFDLQFRLATGNQIRWVHGRGLPEKGPDGRTGHMTGTLVDITEHKMLQAEMERQQQSLVRLTRVGAIGELSGALAHELNQPLTAILSNAQAIQRMIRRDPVNMEELRGAVDDIIEDDSRAGDVIRHLHALLKRGEAAARTAVDMNELIQKVIDLARNEFVTRQVLPVIELCENAPPVLGDAVQLQQLLLNLVLNAAEAIGGVGQKNGIVIIAGQVEADEGDLRYHLSVSDTGPGIKNDIMEKLFEPFLSTKKQGLGLGLSISRAIVVGHGGAIRAENNSWGGATFHVFLPLAQKIGEPRDCPHVYGQPPDCDG